MCLISNTDTPSTSTYDIECYKVLIEEKGKLYSPYQRYEYEVDDLYIDSTLESPVETFAGFSMIEKGYYHTYKSKEAAKILILELESCFRRTKQKLPKIKIYKAEIPAGTRFFEGQYSDLASKSLKILEECCD